VILSCYTLCLLANSPTVLLWTAGTGACFLLTQDSNKPCSEGKEVEEGGEGVHSMDTYGEVLIVGFRWLLLSDSIAIVPLDFINQ
jgi:hypothetical protein